MIEKVNLNTILDDYRTKSEEEIIQEAEGLVVRLAQQTYDNVFAYNDFINSVGDKDIFSNFSIESFKELPLTDKQEYLKKYSRKQLVNNDAFSEKSWVISATSGSTGEPFYFPRDEYQDIVYSCSAEAYLRTNFGIENKSSLYIIAFPMGIWIGGVFTFSALYNVSKKGYPLTIVTPGINKLEIIRAIKNLGPDFDQIIIGSYAPFLKDIIDDGEQNGINWKSIPIKFIFSAEAFSEEFRDYLESKTGINQYLDTLNHYGTVDLGTMAHETPYSILIRKIAYKKPDLFKDLFGEIARTPTLAQFDPRLFYFEEFNKGELCCSASTGYPLVRYNLHDRGGVRTKKQVEDLFAAHGIDLHKEAEDLGISHTIWNLPFVFVYERSDFSISYYAFQIYPEVVRKALLSEKLEKSITGKFTMEVEYQEGRQQLVIYIETRPGYDVSVEIEQIVSSVIHDSLYSASSEYRQTCDQIGVEIVRPQIRLRQYEDSIYFRPGGKQAWVKK